MAFETAYIAIGIVALILVAGILVFTKNKRKEKLTPLAGLAFAFVIAGIAFGDERIIGYSLMGIGIILAVVDIYLKKKK